MSEEHRFLAFNAELSKLAERHGTTPEVIVSIFTEMDFEQDWRRLYRWVEADKFLHRIAGEGWSRKP